MDKHSALPIYEVEFIPLERRTREDRRKHSACGYSGPERRQSRSRRDSEVVAKSRRQA